MHHDIEAIQEKIHQESAFVERLLGEVGRVIVGQRAMVERLVIGLLADGHVLLEGVPGLAKTLTVRTLARAVDTTFRRIQFTPDLLPADLIGTLVYDPQHAEFRTKKGPIFSNLILADEINRSPAKVQSALPRGDGGADRDDRPSGPTRSISRSWCSPPRTRSSRRGRIRCPRRRSTASCSRWWSAIPAGTRRSR